MKKNHLLSQQQSKTINQKRQKEEQANRGKEDYTLQRDTKSLILDRERNSFLQALNLMKLLSSMEKFCNMVRMIIKTDEQNTPPSCNCIFFRLPFHSLSLSLLLIPNKKLCEFCGLAFVLFDSHSLMN